MEPHVTHITSDLKYLLLRVVGKIRNSIDKLIQRASGTKVGLTGWLAVITNMTGCTIMSGIVSRLSLHTPPHPTPPLSCS